MNPKLYFDNSLIGDRDNELFCFLPFQDASEKRFEQILKPAAYFKSLNCKKADEEKSSKEILERIYDGINKSRLLLFDLSQDDRYGGKINPNVAYELGVARSTRHDMDILLITDVEEIVTDIPFDLRGMNIIKTKNLTKEKFYEILKLTLEAQEYFQDKRIALAARLIGGEGLMLMYKYGGLPDGYSHFGSHNLTPNVNMSALRLLDLAILKTESICYKKGYEYAYHWTSFGKAVIKYLGINKIDMESYQKSAVYQEFLKDEEAWREFKKNVAE